MSESVDIHNLLQAGYFTTSRNRSSHRPSSASPESPLSRPVSPKPILLPPPPSIRPLSQQRRPPPPSVDDEDTVLKSEHGSIRQVFDEEDAQSRGDIDQQPVIMEVHEHNPERRFVIVDEDLAETDDVDREQSNGYDGKSKRRTSFQSKNDTGGTRRGEREKELSTEERPRISRRRSRQELPVIDTGLGDGRESHHHRSQSAMNATRPDYFSQMQSRRYADEMLLSPDIIKPGTNGREQTYYGYSGSKPKDSRTQQEQKERERGIDRSQTSSRSKSTHRQSGTSNDANPARRPLNDKASEERSRDPRRTSRYETAEVPRRHQRQPSYEKERARESRESSRSQTDYPLKSPRTFDLPKLIVTHDGRRAERAEPPQKEKIPLDRSPSRSQTIPILSSKSSDASDKTPLALRPSATFQAGKAEKPAKSVLPYPDEDESIVDPIASVSKRRGDDRRSHVPVPTATMPHMPVVGAEAIATPRVEETTSKTSKLDADDKPWQPTPFNPDTDGIPLEKPMGVYRRYSENGDQGNTDQLPECPRTRPVAGKMDWLTLPRSAFNICPDCYGSVFSNTEHRTHFQPVLRQTTEGIVCDFGSSPWFRIAWLLTVKDQSSDLRLFHQLADLLNSPRSQPCPQHRKSTRNWLTVRDPHTRRAVPEFTVCCQCAKIVEALLPNLAGVFVPLDSKQEPTKSACALHFTPERKEFVDYFDAFETTSERSAVKKQPPNVGELAKKLERLCVHNECREDRPVADGYWHYMQFLPQFTVCGDCFDEVVRPRLADDNVVARNFYMKPQKIPIATCQLYSDRMRDIFKRSCRRNDPQYLEAKVKERLRIEADIHAKLVKLDQAGQRSTWTDEQVDKLVREWKKWE